MQDAEHHPREPRNEQGPAETVDEQPEIRYPRSPDADQAACRRTGVPIEPESPVDEVAPADERVWVGDRECDEARGADHNELGDTSPGSHRAPEPVRVRGQDRHRENPGRVLCRKRESRENADDRVITRSSAGRQAIARREAQEHQQEQQAFGGRKVREIDEAHRDCQKRRRQEACRLAEMTPADREDRRDRAEGEDG